MKTKNKIEKNSNSESHVTTSVSVSASVGFLLYILNHGHLQFTVSTTESVMAVAAVANIQLIKLQSSNLLDSAKPIVVPVGSFRFGQSHCFSYTHTHSDSFRYSVYAENG